MVRVLIKMKELGWVMDIKENLNEVLKIFIVVYNIF